MRFSLSARPRCGCRDAKTGRQLGASCKKLASGRHGTWTWQLKGTELQKIAAGGRIRHGGHGSKRTALTEGESVKRLFEILEPGDANALAEAVRLVRSSLAGECPMPTEDEIRRRYAAGSVLAVRIATEEYLTEWLQGRKRIRKSTRRLYEAHIRLYIAPNLGHIPLDRLRLPHVEAMFASIEMQNEKIVEDNEARRAVQTALREARKAKNRRASRKLREQLAEMPRYRRPAGPATRARIREPLRKALNDARRKGLIGTNPAADVELDAAPRSKPLVWTSERVARWNATGKVPSPVMVWTPEQTTTFLRQARDHRLYALYHVIAHRGTRRGETVGLPWTDVDLDSGIVTIREQIVQLGWEVETGRPKSDAGDRPIALDTGTVEVLKAHRERQAKERRVHGDEWINSGMTFTQENGEPLHPATVTKTFRQITEEAGLPPIRLHDLRHGAATIALATGTDIKVVQELLGHSSSTLTRDTYTSVLPELQRSAAEAIAALLTGKPAAETNRTGLTSASHRDLEQDSDDDRAAKPQVRPLNDGAPSGTRTPNPLVKSQLLCQLS